jgi:hypothetical protein
VARFIRLSTTMLCYKDFISAVAEEDNDEYRHDDEIAGSADVAR